ncbi:TIGR02678 family protein [Microbacterium sp. LRZ72]|uniref:TIGR02678 family protein n=1 Tax=Microbacterium sp. LRZ72 TaxID=2942481 RepID=UPI0029B654C0|nr:TIGR02678 family protein [Microbacterium sp. LRZ72]MDX2377876.1 TIGR02678 family protein [Microbacterium sp. LRZ72]
MSPLDAASGISGTLEARDVGDRVRVLRALLMHPVLRADADGELFRLARRHADVLRTWLERETGWRVIVESQTVRLANSYVPRGATAEAIAQRHPARARRGDPPFTRRRYVLLCLALSVLERSDLQIALGRLAEEIVLAARQPGLADIEFTLTGREQRSDLVAAIRLLLGRGVLVRVAGDEESYVSANGDALYDVDRRVLSTMLAPLHAPGLVAMKLGVDAPIDQIEDALHAPPPAYTDEETTRRVRHAVTRRLLCDPVVYYEELPDDERAYLVSQRVALTRRLAVATGLTPELRAEGVALVDPEDQLTDLRMPEQGTDGHVTLLLAGHLAERGPTSVDDLRAMTKRLAHENAAFWRKTTREAGAENALVTDAVDRLVALGLARIEQTGEDDIVHPLPALARFAVLEPTITERKTR